MPKTFTQYIEGENIYSCANCQTHLTSLSELVSKDFQGPHGSAYLFCSVKNVIQGELYEQEMRSGKYWVRDLFCIGCGEESDIGWTYVRATSDEQKYKEGKFILAQKLLMRQNWNDY